MLKISVSGETYLKLRELKDEYQLKNLNEVIKAMYAELIRMQV